MTIPHCCTLGATGPWLVICHGMALDYRDLLPLAHALAADWRVLLWDLPGHGQSAPLARYTLAVMTDALEAVMAANNINRATLLGFSFGGMVVQDFLRRHPHRVGALVAYGCFAPFSQPAPLPRVLVGPLVAAMGLRRWSDLRREFARACALTEPARQSVEATADPIGKRTFLAMTRALLSAFNYDSTFAIPCPLLTIRGAEDSNGARVGAAAEALASLATDVSSVTIAMAGHCADLDQPAAFQAAIMPWLARIRSGVAATTR